MTITDTPETKPSVDAEPSHAKYTENWKGALDTVSARSAKPEKSKPAKADLKKLAVDLALDVKPRTFVDVAKDLARCEQRQAAQRSDLAATDAEIVALQKELKTLTDEIGKRR